MEQISQAPDSAVRAILIALCEDPRNEKKALAYLEKLRDRTAMLFAAASGSSRSRHDPALVRGPNGARKRKAESTVQICARCEEPFYPEDNNDGKPCRYHPGEMEVDDEGDFWADNDEYCHGNVNTSQMREEYPEGFFWDCCDKAGTSKGCTRGRHHAADDRRARMMSSDDNEDQDEEDEDEDEDEDE